MKMGLRLRLKLWNKAGDKVGGIVWGGFMQCVTAQVVHVRDNVIGEGVWKHRGVWQ